MQPNTQTDSSRSGATQQLRKQRSARRLSTRLSCMESEAQLRKCIEEKLVIRDNVGNSKFAENGSTPTLGTARGALKKRHY